MTPPVAIVIGYRSQDVIGDCITALLDVADLRIYVWDNSPDLETRSVINALRSDRVVVLSDGQNYGFGGGVNRAAKAITKEVQTDVNFIVVNPDCMATPRVIERMNNRVNESDAGMVAPRMRYPDGRAGFAGGPWPSMLKEIAASTRLDDLLPVSFRNKILATGARIMGKKAMLVDSLREGPELDVDWVSGFCFAIRSELFESVGGFDEDYFLYFEDVDLARRVKSLGYRNIVLRDIEALHYESTSTRGVGKSKVYWQGFATYCSKHKSRGAARVASLMA